MTNTFLTPAMTRKSLGNTSQYAAGTISILLTREDTGGLLRPTP